MKEKLETRKKALSEEFAKLVNTKNQLNSQLAQINQRLLQLQGSYGEVETLLKDLESLKANGSEELVKKLDSKKVKDSPHVVA